MGPDRAPSAHNKKEGVDPEVAILEERLDGLRQEHAILSEEDPRNPKAAALEDEIEDVKAEIQRRKAEGV